MQFKNAGGKWITKSLFYELTLAEKPYAVYSLKEQDHTDKDGKVFLSLKRLFLESDDPTEYAFSQEHLGGWSHWQEMQTIAVIAPHIEKWRSERDVRLRSLGVRKMIESAEAGNYQAAKFLTDKGWDVQTKGRPTKEQIRKEAREAAHVKSVVSNDMERIRKLKHGK